MLRVEFHAGRLHGATGGGRGNQLRSGSTCLLYSAPSVLYYAINFRQYFKINFVYSLLLRLSFTTGLAMVFDILYANHFILNL